VIEGLWITQRFVKLITEIIKQFTSGTSYLINWRLHVSVRTGPSSGLLMNQVSNAAYIDDGPVRTETCSLPFIKYDVPEVKCFNILVIKLVVHRDVFNQRVFKHCNNLTILL
jgi:hypothetical protein